MSAGLRTVHVRVNDAATGQPTPVRIRITDSQGNYYAPFGRLADFATGYGEDVGGNLLLGSKKYAYIDGTCEVSLPSGIISVELHKGPEYIPQLFDDRLGAGQITLRYAVERWTDLRAQRWYSGDICAHFLTPHGALLETAAEDLAVVNLLITVSELTSTEHYRPPELTGKACSLPSYDVLSNVLAFSGQRPVVEMPGHLVVVNSRHYHAHMGFLILLNCHRLVHPLKVDEMEGLTRWALADWCDQCHRKGGLVVWDGYSTRSPIDLPYGEGLANLLVGKIDAIEATEALEKSAAERWYPFLDCACPVPLVGSSRKDSNAGLLGGRRTYARLREGQEFNYKNWIEAVRAGRTFVTNGPLVDFAVDGLEPGDVLNLPALDQPIHIRASARSALPFDRMELVLNGEVLADVTASGSPASATLDTHMTLPAPGWLALRCNGTHQVATRERAEPVAAHTAPVYIKVEGQPTRVDPRRAAELLACLDAWIAAIARELPCGNGNAGSRLIRIFEDARRVLQERIQT